MLGENDAKLENEHLASEESKGYRYLSVFFMAAVVVDVYFSSLQ